MNLNDSTLDIIGRSLKVEILNHSRTLLEPKYCPDYFIVREIAGVNQFINGSMKYEIKGRRPIIVQDGIAIILPAGVPIRHTNLAPGKTVSVWHNIRYSILDTVDPLALLEMPPVLNPANSELVGKINSELTDISSEKDRNFLKYIVRRHELGIRLFSIILEVSALRAGARDFILKTERILPVLRHIRKNFTGKITVDELAKLVSLSAPQFFNVFREATGMSPVKYVQLQRMQKAQELLLTEPGIHIYEVAEKTGYEDVFHFSRLFKKNFGVSPELFREQFSSRPE
jgi:AraC-like DNA-binding protein